MAEHPLGIMYENQVRECDRLRAALILARQSLHDACLEIGSTEGYRDTFATINEALGTAPLNQQGADSKP